MIVVERDGAGSVVDTFEVDPRDVVGSWLRRDQERINLFINQVNAECILDYWSRKDPAYVNGYAPMMCYVECVHHGPQIGSRGDYPYPGTSPEGLCPECSQDLVYAIQSGALTVAELTTLSASKKEQILARCRTERQNGLVKD